MSHQVNLFLSMDDAKKLEQIWRSLGPFLILRSYSEASRPTVLESVGVIENDAPLIFMHLVREADLHSVVMRHVAPQKRWLVDVQTSPVIEFTNSFPEAQLLKRGRLYYTEKYLSAHNAWEEKPREFCTWASKLLARTKQALTRRGSDYVGAGAETFEVGGGRLGEVYVANPS